MRDSVANQPNKRVVFAIDEAHYLMNDATSLDFLETAVRHSREYDTPQAITQTGGESHSRRRPGRSQTSVETVIHRVDEAAQQLAEWFGLSDREVDWVQSAKAGNGADGYSEALLGVDEEGWSRFECERVSTRLRSLETSG